ncbi:hypothetical protein BDD12DRAFT_120326 [Trichophaea hybrida]|nr:hypothetical protein BDD12DRAFT_120326 [Trichophaea hybrida]
MSSTTWMCKKPWSALQNKRATNAWVTLESAMQYVKQNRRWKVSISRTCPNQLNAKNNAQHSNATQCKSKRSSARTSRLLLRSELLQINERITITTAVIVADARAMLTRVPAPLCSHPSSQMNCTDLVVGGRGIPDAHRWRRAVVMVAGERQREAV